MKLKTLLIHSKIRVFGDKKLLNEGKLIPCKKCDKLFKSYAHYDCEYPGFFIFDSICEKCLK